MLEDIDSLHQLHLSNGLTVADESFRRHGPFSEGTWEDITAVAQPALSGEADESIYVYLTQSDAHTAVFVLARYGHLYQL